MNDFYKIKVGVILGLTFSFLYKKMMKIIKKRKLEQ